MVKRPRHEDEAEPETETHGAPEQQPVEVAAPPVILNDQSTDAELTPLALALRNMTQLARFEIGEAIGVIRAIVAAGIEIRIPPAPGKPPNAEEPPPALLTAIHGTPKPEPAAHPAEAAKPAIDPGLIPPVFAKDSPPGIA